MPGGRRRTAALLVALLCATGAAAREDPLEVSPERYRLRLANPSYRILEFSLPPGKSDAFHGHPDGIYYVIEGGRVRIHTPAGEPRDVELATGLVGFQSAVDAHRIENVGDTTVRVLMIEDLRAAPDEPAPPTTRRTSPKRSTG